MKVIFLDFDGVLNSDTSFLYESNRRRRHKEQNVKGPVNETLSFPCAAAFQEILYTYPDLKVVISSTWRTMFDLGWLQAKLLDYHIDAHRVIGCTPVDRDEGDRGVEIKWWLDKHPEVEHYVIIDDNDWGITAIHGKDRFIHTTWEAGMTTSHTKEAIYKLSSANKKKIDEAKKTP